MARAVEAVLGERVSEGFVVVKDGYRVPTSRIEIAEAGLGDLDARGGHTVAVLHHHEALAHPLAEDGLHRPRHRRAGLADEIGRASCRERVWVPLLGDRAENKSMG